jgi:hypothetical protein
MSLPFTREQFFEQFAAYNLAVWPAQIALLALALAMAAAVLFRRDRAGRFVSCGLAALWTWTAVAYHLAFFRHINPAAWLFAAIALVSAAAFAWRGAARGRLRFARASWLRALLGWSMLAYALVGYPLLGAEAGHVYPAAPTFGLPCPTTLFTVGLLLLAERSLPRTLLLGPLAWSLIGGTAALALDVPQDFGLFVASAACLYLLLRRPSQRAWSPGVHLAGRRLSRPRGGREP